MRIAGRALALGLAAGFLGGLGVSAAWAQTEPTLQVSPTSGAVGTTVRIGGQGFCPSAGCSSVQVSFAGIVVADGVKVDPDGGFTLTATVPGGISPGEVSIVATQTNSSGQQGVAISTFQVTLTAPTSSPSASVSPTSSPSGSPSSKPSGTATPSGTSTASFTPTPTLVPTPSPSQSGGGTSPLLILAMVLAAVAFLVGVGGMIYILWRSRQTPAPEPEPGPWGWEPPSEGPLSEGPPSERPTAPVGPAHVPEHGAGPADTEPAANPPHPEPDPARDTGSPA
jgi:hypothetical protein